MAFLLPNLSPSLLLQSKSSNPQSINQIPCKPNTTLDLDPLRISSLQTSTVLQDAQLKTSPGDQHHEKDDFYVNIGVAVRTLREDMPLLFTRDLNYDIYRLFPHLGISSFCL